MMTRETFIRTGDFDYYDDPCECLKTPAQPAARKDVCEDKPEKQPASRFWRDMHRLMQAGEISRY